MPTPTEIAYDGHVKALATYGLEKFSWASTALRVGMPLAAYALADDEHKWPAAGLGLMGAMALTSGGKAPGVTPAPVPAPVVAAPKKTAPPISAPATSKKTAPPAKKTPTEPVAVQAKSNVIPLHTPETATNMKEMNDALARRAIPDWESRWQAQYAKDQMRGSRKAASVYGIKESALDELGIGVGVPGTPFSVGMKRNRDRLEGMHRWAPTDTLERAYEGRDQGVDPEELVSQEGRRGLITDPVLGAGLAAALSHYGIPGLSSLGKGPSAGLGALGGLLYNRFTADDREKDMRESVKGVDNERRVEHAITKQPMQPANEAHPILMSRGEA